jgi:hypothetical protein
LRPPRRWKRIGIRTTSVTPSSLASALWIDYAETYGFVILPRGIDLGVGGSTGF